MCSKSTVLSANLSAIFLFLLLHLILPVTEVNWIQQSLSVVRVVVEVVVVTKNCLLSRSLNTVFSYSGATDKTLLRYFLRLPALLSGFSYDSMEEEDNKYQGGVLHHISRHEMIGKISVLILL